MHEFSIVEALLEQVDAIAHEHQFVKVVDVQVEIGQLKLVIPEMMQTAFAAASQGTLCEGAHLQLTEKRLRIQCEDCQTAFFAHIDDVRCPLCRHTNVTMLEGNDILLLSVGGEKKGEKEA